MSLGRPESSGLFIWYPGVYLNIVEQHAHGSTAHTALAREYHHSTAPTRGCRGGVEVSSHNQHNGMNGNCCHQQQSSLRQEVRARRGQIVESLDEIQHNMGNIGMAVCLMRIDLAELEHLTEKLSASGE